jgi:hypothetical protein
LVFSFVGGFPWVSFGIVVPLVLDGVVALLTVVFLASVVSVCPVWLSFCQVRILGLWGYVVLLESVGI